MDIVYKPSPTIKNFMRSDARSRWVMGSVGSGKTTGMIFELVRRAAQTPPGVDGVRRSRWLVTRLTMPQLKDTVLKSWLQWFPDGKFGRWRSNDSTFWLEFNDIQAEIMFRPLESEADVARVLSLELTGAWVAECRDLPVSMISDIKGRCGRFPEPIMDYWYGVFGETNPPAEGSDWYKVFEKLPQEDGNPESVMDGDIFVQPCPVNDDFTLRPEAENVENLKPTYYQDLAKGATSDYIRVFIKGEYGRNRKGQPVYLEAFQRQQHVARKPIPIDAQQPIIVGMDFGLCYSDDMEVLTETGWKLFKDVEETTDRVATLDPERFGLEYTAVNFKVEYDYDGELIEFKGQNFDFVVTPEHRTPFTRRDSKDDLVFASAEELAGKTTTHNYIQLQANWKGKKLEWAGLSGVQAARFLGWYLSEGSIEVNGNSHRVSITQVKQSPELDQLFTTNEWWEGTVWRKNSVGWRATVPPFVGKSLLSFGKSWVKHAPRVLLDADQECIRAFLGAYVLGDGHTRTKAKKNNGVGRTARGETAIATVSTRMADHLQELILKAGWCSTIRVQKARTTYMKDGRQIDCPDMFIVAIKKLTRAEIQKQHITRVPYKGKIYCLNVPFHTLYVRRNGRPCWNGNTPAAIIAQADPHQARLNILREVVTPKGMTNGTEQFIIKRLRPFLRSYFPGNPIVIIGDPANTRAETDERTSFKVLKQYGFIAKMASTQDPITRINAVESLLAMFPHGEAMVQIDPSCKVLIEGFLFGYMFASSKGGLIADKPFKNCIWSHPHDALQYLCLYYNKGYDPQDWLPTSDNPLHHHRGYQPADAYAGY